jgi:transcription initiation factor TFIIIB Brf1 subunit/transcription initiation factor TFIIB
MNDFDVEKIWEEFDKVRVLASTEDIESTICPVCQATISSDLAMDVCKECGYIKKEYLFDSNKPILAAQEVNVRKRHSCTKDDSRMLKINDWYMWSDQEKSNYKLRLYVEDKCHLFSLTEMQTGKVVDAVTKVLELSKLVLEGTKRSKTKDSIIYLCCRKVKGDHRFCENVRGKIGLSMKHITKAEKIMLELAQKDRQLYQFLHSNDCTSHPFDVIKSKLMRIKPLASLEILVIKTIDVIMETDVLLDNTPMSVAVASLCYVIQKSEIEIPIKVLCDVFEISIVTISKAMKKILKHDDKLHNLITQRIQCT